MTNHSAFSFESAPCRVYARTMAVARSETRPWPRVILHADMDAFFAAVEQRDDPSLRGKPLVVGGTQRRGVVSTASYEARKYGLKSAMPMAEALRRCPEVIVRPPDFERYKTASDQINTVFQSYSPLVEPLSLDEAFIDMSGAEGLFGSPEEMGRRIKQDVRDATGGLTISVGASVTKYVAKVASDHQKPDGLTVVPEDAVLDFLWPLSIAKLWGVGSRSQQRLRGSGFHTIRDVASASRRTLVGLLGSHGAHIHDLANGVDPREVIPERDPKSIGKEITLEEDISGLDAVSPHLRRLADQTARRLRAKGCLASGVRVKLKTAGFELHTRQCSLSEPTQSADALLRTAERLLEKMNLDGRFRLVGIAAFSLSGDDGPSQPSLFDSGASKKRQRLERTIDAVLERFGDDAVKRGSDC